MRILSKHLCDLLTQGLALAVGILILRTILVTPLNGPLVVVVDAGEQTFLRDMILGLCHVVEAGIVHDTVRMTVGLYPLLVAQFLHRGKRAGEHIVTQA